ncbi:MAG: NUDIX domain-containing protein, partial [Flavobacteriaceae bacterium]|nr:NUDIX domain-containing protein [Flavobacteriaceae bacterium]
DICIFKNSCFAKQNNKIKTLPVKENKIKIKKRYFNYLIINNKNDNTIIQKRNSNDIWKNLYEFPLHESDKEISINEIINTATFQKLLYKKSYHISIYNKKQIIHKLTHQHLFTTFWIIDSNDDFSNTILWENISEFALPTLIQNFIDEYKK